MLYFEGSISEPSRRSKHQVVFEDEDDEITDLAYSMSLVSASDWGINIDANVFAVFYVPPCFEYHVSSSYDFAFSML